jgi:hypothetical protein
MAAIPQLTKHHMSTYGSGEEALNRAHGVDFMPELGRAVVRVGRALHSNDGRPEQRCGPVEVDWALLVQGNLFAVFGVMGAFMQPQGHLQVGPETGLLCMCKHVKFEPPRNVVFGGQVPLQLSVLFAWQMSWTEK